MPLDFKEPLDGPKDLKGKQQAKPTKEHGKEHGKPAAMHLETQVVPDLIGKVSTDTRDRSLLLCGRCWKRRLGQLVATPPAPLPRTTCESSEQRCCSCPCH